ncbi:MAG: hypothetical protein QW416_05915 [Candidatus Nitrosocaldaceae archaeon]
MGLSIVIAGSIIITTLLISSITTINSINDMFEMSMINNYSIKLNNEKSDTNITISSIQANSNNNLVTLSLNNNGTSKLWDYNHFDLIITYDANISNNKIRVTEYMIYSTVLSNGRWTLSITDDIADPNILNPNETAIINARLSNVIYPNGKIIVAISTNNGVIFTIGRVVV